MNLALDLLISKMRAFVNLYLLLLLQKCWRRLLRVPWTARRSSQSILKEINPKYSLEGLMLKLKLQYFGHLVGRADSLEKTWCWERLTAGGEENYRGWDGWMASPTQWTWIWANSGDGEGQGSLACCSPWGREESNTTEWLNNSNKSLTCKPTAMSNDTPVSQPQEEGWGMRFALELTPCRPGPHWALPLPSVLLHSLLSKVFLNTTTPSTKHLCLNLRLCF